MELFHCVTSLINLIFLQGIIISIFKDLILRFTCLDYKVQRTKISSYLKMRFKWMI